VNQALPGIVWTRLASLPAGASGPKYTSTTMTDRSWQIQFTRIMLRALAATSLIRVNNCNGASLTPMAANAAGRCSLGPNSE
jgi:hypothetical protein